MCRAWKSQAKEVWLLHVLLVFKFENAIFDIFVSLGCRDLFSVVRLDYLIVHSCSVTLRSQRWSVGQQHWALGPGGSAWRCPSAIALSLPVESNGKCMRVNYWWTFRNVYCKSLKALLLFAVSGLFDNVCAQGKAEQLRLETTALLPQAEAEAEIRDTPFPS